MKIEKVPKQRTEKKLRKKANAIRAGVHLPLLHAVQAADLSVKTTFPQTSVALSTYLCLRKGQPCRFLSGAMVFKDWYAEPLAAEFVTDIKASDVFNLTRCHKSVFPGTFNHSAVFLFRHLSSDISSLLTDAFFVSKALTVLFTIACVIEAVRAISFHDAPSIAYLRHAPDEFVCTGTRGGTVTITRNVLKGMPAYPTHIYAERDKCLSACLHARMASRLTLRSC